MTFQSDCVDFVHEVSFSKIIDLDGFGVVFSRLE